MENCTACIKHAINLNCRWCEVINHCSDGLDRKHQEWMSASCHVVSVNTTCPVQAKSSVVKTTKAAREATNPPSPATKSDIVDYSATSKSPSVEQKSKYVMVKGSTSLPINGIAESSSVAKESLKGANFGVAVAVIAALLLVGTIVGWIFYAYMRPLSVSGQWLIRYRPNQWRRNRDDEVHIASTTF